jgi:teichuronic acid biosynthesis glycosyltransferase TuaH
MIKNQQIVCITSTTWFGYYTKSTVQILERLAAHNEILFIEYPHTWKDILMTWLGKQQGPLVSRMLGIRKRLQSITTASSTRIYDLVTPPALPVYFLKNENLFERLFRYNKSIYRRSVTKAMREIGFVNPIVITAFHPFYGDAMLRQLNEKLHLYYCFDAVETWFYGQRIIETERQYIRKVDGVITTSDQLNQEKKELNPNCYTVKNGVDFQLFAPHARKGIAVRERKKIGYIGSLDHRFDIELVKYVVSYAPGYDFEFTGALLNMAVKEQLSGFPNVRLFPPVDSGNVPALLASYDAGLIPYIQNEPNKNIYPLKINEYLAVGVPLVMTAFAHLPEFSSMVSTAGDKETFLDKLHAEINSDSLVKVQDRINFARNNSWEARTEEFSNVLSRFLES